MDKRAAKPKRKRPNATDHLLKWYEYEREKRKLQSLYLSPDEYELRIYEIAKRLGV